MEAHGISRERLLIDSPLVMISLVDDQLDHLGDDQPGLRQRRPLPGLDW